MSGYAENGGVGFDSPPVRQYAEYGASPYQASNDGGELRRQHDIRDSERDRGRSRENDHSKEREKDRHHRDHHRDRSDRDDRSRRDRERDRDKNRDRDYERHRSRDHERYRDYDRDSDRRHKHRSHSRSRRSKERSRSRSKSKRVSGFDMAPPGSAVMASANVTGQIPGISQPMPGMFPNMFPFGNTQFGSLPVMPAQAMTQQATRHARRVYVGSLPPMANEQKHISWW